MCPGQRPLLVKLQQILESAFEESHFSFPLRTSSRVLGCIRCKTQWHICAFVGFDLHWWWLGLCQCPHLSLFCLDVIDLREFSRLNLSLFCLDVIDLRQFSRLNLSLFCLDVIDLWEFSRLNHRCFIGDGMLSLLNIASLVSVLSSQCL